MSTRSPLSHTEVLIASLTKEIDRFAEGVIRALFGPLLDEVERNIINGINTHMDTALQAALGRLTDKIGEQGTRVIGAVAKETGEVKTALKGVAQQIRDGASPADAIAAIDAAADGVGALGDQLVQGIDAISDGITVANAEPDTVAPGDATV